MINWKVRFKNPVWWAQVVVAILAPILGYMGITAADLGTWAELGRVLMSALGSPYVIGLVLVNVWSTINDPTTAGLKDSARAMAYCRPCKHGQP